MSNRSATSLRSLQTWMQHCILNPSDSEAAEQWIEHSERLTARQHLGIYQRSYVARLRDCMSKQFPALEFAMGNDLFQMFVDDYLQTHPSSSYTLMNLGDRFAGYLQATRPDRESEVKESWPDFLIELASFEYHLNVTFDEPESKESVPATAETPDEAIRLVPIFRLFAFRYPIPAWHSAFRNGRQPDPPPEHPSWCAVLRCNRRIAVQGLSRWQYQFLADLNGTGSVLTAIQRLAAYTRTDSSKITAMWTAWRPEWARAGFFSTCSAGD